MSRVAGFFRPFFLQLHYFWGGLRSTRGLIFAPDRERGLRVLALAVRTDAGARAEQKRIFAFVLPNNKKEDERSEVNIANPGGGLPQHDAIAHLRWLRPEN